MPSDQALKHDFLKSLADEFGPGFLELIQEPAGTLVGERVLYKYRNNQAAERRPMTGQEFQSLRFQLENIAGEVGGRVSIDPPDNSGLPHPRTVDIKEMDLVFENRATRWVQGEELLPTSDFKLEWLLGIIHWSDYKQLLFIDFTHPQVKCTFTADYDDLYDQNIGKNMAEQMEALLEEKNKLTGELKGSAGFAKIASFEGKLLSKIQKV
jgi:hypothetical protein